MNIKQMLQEQEQVIFCRYAAFSSQSKGRLYDAPECEIRPVYQLDRDSIIHCKSFRRLKHKTQVFLAPTGDHYRTRLTHTLEVSQIARTIAKSLRLNEDLTEAIALGHDLGHTPFGHAGESVLNEIYPGGFKHVEQSLRVVDLLERDGRGLNLSYEVRDGIVKHSKGDNTMFAKNNDEMAGTLEGQIVRLADTIAYVNHDIDDALRAEVIVLDDLPKDCLEVLGCSHAKRINTMVIDIIYSSLKSLPVLSASPHIIQATEKLRRFLTKKVYYNKKSYTEFKKAYKVIKELYYHFLEYPKEMSSDYRSKNEDNISRLACDFIAGMTDRYALKLYEEIFLPKPWRVI